jgi:hypothetical protein
MAKVRAWWVVVLATLMPASAQAYELKHTKDGQPVRWPSAQVSFVVDPTLEAAVPGAGMAVASAMASWSGAEGAPVLSYSVGKAPGVIAVDGVNSVLYAPKGYPPAGDALAVTLVSFSDETGEIVDTDIVINGAHAFAVLAAGAQASGPAVALDAQGSGGAMDGPFDVEHVVSHEVGHALGLADVDAEGDAAVMFAYTAPGDPSRRGPQADDRAGIQALYGTTSKAGCSLAAGAGGAGATDGGVGCLGLMIVAGAMRRLKVRRSRP